VGLFPLVQDLNASRNLLSDISEGLCGRNVGLTEYDRLPHVSPFPDCCFQRNSTQKWDIVFLAGPHSPAMAENVSTFFAMGANEVAHILDDPEDIYVHLPEHHDSLPGIRKRHILGCCDDHASHQRD